MARTRRLSREQWIEEALAVIAEGGVGALAVEPLAVRLGVTKGSFYWHFKDREALLAAALEAWEHERTRAVIAEAEGAGEPRERLEAWARYALAADKSLLVALHAAADHPVVAPVLRRVTEVRLRWLADLLRDAGVPPATARRRARLLYGADIGLFEIAQALPGERPAGRELTALARELQDAFLP